MADDAFKQYLLGNIFRDFQQLYQLGAIHPSNLEIIQQVLNRPEQYALFSCPQSTHCRAINQPSLPQTALSQSSEKMAPFAVHDANAPPGTLLCARKALFIRSLRQAGLGVLSVRFACRATTTVGNGNGDATKEHEAFVCDQIGRYCRGQCCRRVWFHHWKSRCRVIFQISLPAIYAIDLVQCDKIIH